VGSQGEAKLYVLVNGVVEMVLAVADNVREAIPHTIRTLHKLKVRPLCFHFNCPSYTCRPM
jgi:cation transport ATPase